MAKTLKFTYVLALILAVGFVAPRAQERAAAGQTRGTQSTAPPTLQPHNPRYQLSIGDSFDIIFQFTPEYNQAVTIQPDGFVNLRDLPDMHVAGKTTPELLEQLRSAYGKILHDPVISVQLRDFQKPFFVVGGWVARPGKYDLRSDTTVTQAIAIAGGFNEYSRHSQVLIFRRMSSQWTEVRKLDMKAMLKNADLKEDLRLLDGDMLYIPQNTISKIKRFIPTANVGVYVNGF